MDAAQAEIHHKGSSSHKSATGSQVRLLGETRKHLFRCKKGPIAAVVLV